MGSDWDVVDVWVGVFPDANSFHEYCEELDRDTPDDPISQFADDMGQVFVDHDLFLGTFQIEPSRDLASWLRERHPHVAASAEFADAEYRRLDLGAFNVVVTVVGRDVRNPRSVRQRGYRLDYVGRFKCELDASSSVEGQLP